jgi:hypothetical protein
MVRKEYSTRIVERLLVDAFYRPLLVSRHWRAEEA